MNNNKETELNIELPEGIAEGSYSNFALISHSGSEFVIDFIKMLPGIPKPKVTSRIIMTPENTKNLALMLSENIRNYEKQFGEIRLGVENGEQQVPAAGFGKKAEA